MNTYMWNPWHGCHKCSEGCLRCYMYEQDKAIGVRSDIVKRNKTGFKMPVQKIRQRKGEVKLEKYELKYKIPSGSIIMTCLTSDFFLEEADIMRVEAWEFIQERYECLFHIITKRPERITQCLPDDWGTGWKNVMISVTAENNERAWERIPILLDSPIMYKGIVIAPMIEQMDIRPFLSSGIIDMVAVSGESYNGIKGKPRVLKIEWVKDISKQCKEYNTSFKFFQTGTRLEVENNKVVRVRRSDEHNLADFYKLDNIEQDSNINNWDNISKEIMLNRRAEQAYNIFKQLTLEDLG